MKISFDPELPNSDDWATVEKNIRNEIQHFRDVYANFPTELIVKVKSDQLLMSVSGAAVGVDGKPVVTIEYALHSPHSGQYQYVGGQPLAE